MAPANPPLPGTTNLPFHPAIGIQSSILMSESARGNSEAVTRQKAGRSANGDGGAPRVPRPASPGGAGGAPRRAGAGNCTKAPAATVLANVMDACGTVNVARLSHVAAVTSGAPRVIRGNRA